MYGDGYHSVTQWWWCISYLGVVGGGRGVDGLLVLGGVSGVAVDDLHAHLLGQGELDGLAGGGSKLGHALLQGLGHLLNLGHGDALVLGQVLAGDSGQADGLVDTNLNGLRVCNINSRFHRGNNWYISASLLFNLLADMFIALSMSFSVTISVSISIAISIAMTIALTVTMAITMSIANFDSIAQGDYLSVTFFLEGNLNILGRGCLCLRLI